MGPGGAETIFVDLADNLRKAGYRSIGVAPEGSWAASALKSRGIEVVETAPPRAFDLSYLVLLWRLVRRESVGIIQAHLYGSAVYGGLIGLLRGIPVVATFHGQWDIVGDKRLRWLKWACIRLGVSRLVFVSESLRKYFIDTGLVGSSKARVVPNGIAATGFSPGRDEGLKHELGLGEGTVVVGSVGNVRPAKGYDVLLRAAAILARAPSSYCFVIAGDYHGATGEALLRLRDELGLNGAVRFLGFREDIERVLRGLDLFVLPSRAEGFSLALVQALACGIPSIATRSGGPEDIVGSSGAAELVEPNSPESLATAVAALWQDNARREQFRARGPHLVAAKYTSYAMVKGYCEIYDETGARRIP